MSLMDATETREHWGPRDLVPASTTLSTPFAERELAVGDEEDHLVAPRPEPASPFAEAFLSDGDVATGEVIGEMLAAELEDEEFAEALEALGAEAARRYLDGAAGWNNESSVPMLDDSDVSHWMQSIAGEVDDMLAELEQRFVDRAADTVTEEELDAVLGRWRAPLDGFADPLDARELFFGSLGKKLKKVASAAAGVAKKVVKTGVSLASKMMPIGIIFAKLRPYIDNLLKAVLDRAIGKLPRHLREPAGRLAQRFGGGASSRSGSGRRPRRRRRPRWVAGELESELRTEAEFLAAEFDATTASLIVADDSRELEMIIADASDEIVDADSPNVAADLDAARERLAQQLLEAEAGYEPIREIEQFLPAAILPIVRTGIKIVGRKRVVDFAAGILAKLIAPVVGKQLARPLSAQIADKGLALLSLEAEVGSGRLGAEAMVATIEDTLAETFAVPEDLLQNEPFMEATMEEAFHRAAARHFPASFLKAGGAGPSTPNEDGVWVMMPRSTAPLYRYRKYSRVMPIRVSRAMAREVVFSDGETLQERLADAGETSWPVDVELEAYELLPAAELGHLAAFESDFETESVIDALAEFDTLEEAGRLPVPAELRGRGRDGAARRRVVRLSTRGRRLRRRSPVAVRLDMGGQRPALSLHVHIGERRAMALAAHAADNRSREVVGVLRSVSSEPMRAAVARRLAQLLTRHGIRGVDATLRRLVGQLFDGTVAAIAEQLPSMASSLAAAVKDPARGLTLTARFEFATPDVLSQPPSPPSIAVRAGRHRE